MKMVYERGTPQILGEELTEQIKFRTTKSLKDLFDKELEDYPNQTALMNQILYERYFKKKK